MYFFFLVTHILYFSCITLKVLGFTHKRYIVHVHRPSSPCLKNFRTSLAYYLLNFGIEKVFEKVLHVISGWRTVYIQYWFHYLLCWEHLGPKIYWLFIHNVCNIIFCPHGRSLNVNNFGWLHSPIICKEIWPGGIVISADLRLRPSHTSIIHENQYRKKITFLHTFRHMSGVGYIPYWMMLK